MRTYYVKTCLSLKVVLKGNLLSLLMLLQQNSLNHPLHAQLFLSLPKNRTQKSYGSMLEFSSDMNRIFAEETATLLASKSMKNTFKDIKKLAVIKNKSSLKNLVVKTKI